MRQFCLWLWVQRGLVLALLHQERFLARRVIERILKDSMIETQKPVEQYVPPKSDRAGG